MKRVLAVLALLIATLGVSTPAWAAPQQRSATAKTDTMPTTVTLTYDTSGSSALIECITVRTGAGRTRVIDMYAYAGNTKLTTIRKGYKQAHNETVICIGPDYKFTSRYKPNFRFHVVEQVPGPWKPKGDARINLY